MRPAPGRLDVAVTGVVVVSGIRVRRDELRGTLRSRAVMRSRSRSPGRLSSRSIGSVGSACGGARPVSMGEPPRRDAARAAFQSSAVAAARMAVMDCQLQGKVAGPRTAVVRMSNALLGTTPTGGRDALPSARPLQRRTGCRLAIYASPKAYSTPPPRRWPSTNQAQGLNLTVVQRECRHPDGGGTRR